MHDVHYSLLHLAVIALLAFGVGVGAGGAFFSKTIVAREGTADTPAALTSVNLMIDDGTSVRTWNTVSWHEAQSVLTLMQEVAATGNITLDTTEDGTSVRTIDQVSNTDTTRWQYWVNNSYQPVGANKYYLKPGDIIVWKYTVEQKK